MSHQRNSKAQAPMHEAEGMRRRGGGKDCEEVRGIRSYRTLTFAWVGWRAFEAPEQRSGFLWLLCGKDCRVQGTGEQRDPSESCNTDLDRR